MLHFKSLSLTLETEQFTSESPHNIQVYLEFEELCGIREYRACLRAFFFPVVHCPNSDKLTKLTKPNSKTHHITSLVTGNLKMFCKGHLKNNVATQ